MSDVIYGSALLRNVQFREFSQTPKRDPSNTDIWYTEFIVRVSSIVNAATWNLNQLWAGGPTVNIPAPPLPATVATTSNLGASVNSGYQAGISSGGPAIEPDTPTALIALQKALGKDRQSFRLILNGSAQSGGLDNNPYLGSQVIDSVSVVIADPAGQSNTKNPDVDNGPKVLEIRVTQITPETIGVEFGVRICLSGCSSNPTVLGNRFSQSDSYDEMFRCTRRWRGTLRMATNQTKLSDFRTIVLPPLQTYFKRSRMHFEQSQDGLELGYEVTDEEMASGVPPAPALRISGHHREQTDIAGIVYTGDISVTLDGPRTAAHSDLLRRCIEIALAKISAAPFNANGSQVVMDRVAMAIDLSDTIKNATFQCQFRRLNPNQSSMVSTMNNSQTAICTPLSKLDLEDYQPGVVRNLGPFGSAGTAGIVACLLQIPCDTDHGYDRIGTTNPQTTSPGGTATPATPTETQPTSTIATVPAINSYFNQTPLISSAQQTTPYTFAKIDTIRKRNQTRIALPIAATQNPSSQQNDNADTCAIINLGPPTMQLIARMSYERLGAWPDMLMAQDFTDANQIKYAIMSATEDKRPPKPNGAGQFIYAIDAEFVFQMSRTPKSGDVLSVGTLPWTVTTPAQDASGQKLVAANSPLIGLA